ncbi:MAG: HAD family phosphatase [Candidatus Pacebacteria bacterium]|jgi:2-haloacid dehalogenase|nr:HAD family phosphatase [Candidatus Paceibacterota bacterium]
MKKIKNIIFDFGGVLLDWNPKYFYRTFFWDEKEMEHFLSNVCTEEWNAEQDRGRSFSEGVKLLQFQHPEYREAIQLYSDKWEDMLKSELPEGVNLLHELKNQGYCIYGLTNWSAETIQIVYHKYNFFKLFDGIVVSGEEKLIKPDIRIYHVLLDRYGLKATESVFFDDNVSNVRAAKELGIKAILFDNISNVRKQLSDILTFQSI